MVEDLESRYALRGAEDATHGHVLKGDPITLSVEWTVGDLEFAVSRIFSAAEPFRLWGLPKRIGPDHYRVRAVDLHVGGVLGFDLTREWITIQLPEGMCGNSIVRFLSGLRFHVNADVNLRWLEEGRPVRHL